MTGSPGVSSGQCPFPPAAALPEPRAFDSIGACFAAVVQACPEDVALDAAEDALTYRQFDARSNGLARAIAARAVRGPQRIALLFDQGPAALIATFGALKAGHAFVPLDAGNPPARLRAILDDCQPALLVTGSEHAQLAASLAGPALPVLHCEDPSAAPAAAPPAAAPGPDSTAYLIYTSGSTGQPKGVCQTHRNLLHYITAYTGALGITGDDRLSLLYSLSFSAANMDVFGSLLRGATLCPYDIRRRGTAALPDWIDARRITILHAVPTVFRHLLQSLPPGRRFAAIRGVDLGGEAVYPADVSLFREHFPENCRLINHLAATEISVIAQYQADPRKSYQGDMLPVGRPPADTIIRILRADGAEAAPGEQGEMVVHSPCLSPGYWQRPDLTAAAFAPDPARPGWRTYRSGDLGYFDTDGNLFFLGRKDLRVKIRGHSVDTAEVEAALRDHSWIRDLAVVAPPDPADPQSRLLVAYLKAESGDRSRLGALRRELQDRLPPYMIPARFAFLDSLPLTTSGKIDRRSLLERDLPPEPEIPAAAEERPADALERQVLDLFSEVLRRPVASRAEDFFALGGDSLKATRLHAMLQESLGIALPLERLFRDASAAGIAAFLREEQSAPGASGGGAAPSVLVPLRTSGTRPPLFLTHGAPGTAFVSPHFLQILGDEQPVYAYQATGLDRRRLPTYSVAQMAAEYVAALRAVQPLGPYFLGSLCVGAIVTLEMARLLRESGGTVGPLLLIDPPGAPPGRQNAWKRCKRLWKTRWRKLSFRFSSDSKMSRKLRHKREQGRIALGADSRSLEAAARAAFDFEIAAIRHRQRPYDGPVLILASAERRSDQDAVQAVRDAYAITGSVRYFRVDGRHKDLHDVTNAQFASQLRSCVEEAWRFFEQPPR